MNLDPFLNTSLVIQIHIVSALLALVIGTILLVRRKGTRTHKLQGKVWVGMMAVVAISSFFINEIRLVGPFSPIHILSVVTLYSLFEIVRTARLGKMKQHQYTVQALFLGGLIVAGGLTFMPGRRMFEIFFGKPENYLATLEGGVMLSLALAAAIWLMTALKARWKT